MALNNIVIPDTFDCIVCYGMIHPPVTMCVNGHSVCQSCTDKLDKCAICRSTSIGHNNLKLLKSYRQLNIPCDQNQIGCDFTSKLGNVYLHQQTCAYKPVKCLYHFCQVEVGMESDLATHYEHFHNYIDMSIGVGPCAKWYVLIMDLKPLLENNPGKTMKYGTIYPIFGTLFRIIMCFEFDEDEKQVYHYRTLKALEITDAEKCKNYEFTVEHRDGHKKVMSVNEYMTTDGYVCDKSDKWTFEWKYFEKLCFQDDFRMDISARRLDIIQVAKLRDTRVKSIP